jgi:GT2 family glycosyltransferase
MAVVVTCHRDVASLRSCLANITRCCGAVGAELIVTSAVPATDLEDVIREFPNAKYIAAPQGTSVGELRRIGLLETYANVVSFVDDFAIERQSWIVQLCAGFGSWASAGTRIAAQTCQSSGSAVHPRLSVVVPVHDGRTDLASTLEALMLTDLPRQAWELVVVDDASMDGTEVVAAEYADRLVRLPGRAHGPGYARNRGFEFTLGDYIAFVNADVMVRRDTLRRSISELMEHVDVGAVFGCYDTQPAALGLVSQYRNLLQHYAVRSHAGDAQTFSSACGTIRSSVFEQSGGYDEWHFPRRQLEDLELGQRIRRLGHRIVAHPEIRATHLRRWTLGRMIATEILDRTVPWMRFLNRHVDSPRCESRNLRSIKRVNTLVTWLSAGIAMAAWYWRIPALAVAGAICFTAVIVNNADQLRFFYRERGLAFAAATIPLDILTYLTLGVGAALGWITQQIVGEPRPGATAEAFSEMGVKSWPPAPAKRVVAHPMEVPLTPTVIWPLADAPSVAEIPYADSISIEASNQPVQAPTIRSN